MATETLAGALEREHHEIDDGIQGYLESRGANGGVDELRRAMEALRRHIYLEEEFLFPPLRDAGMQMPVMVMIREHGEIWHTLDAIEADLAQGADAGARCDELLAQLASHNMKEEAVLYPRTDDALTAAESQQLQEFLATGRTPEGWVCYGLRDAA